MYKLLSASIIAIAFALPALADNEPTTPTLIPSSEPGCNQAVLNTTEGSASLEAIYTPNTIGTTWYSDGVQITGNNVPSTCTYDTAMTLPTNPTKAGYEFNGWKIKRCEIPSADVSNNGSAKGYKNDSTGQWGANGSNMDTFNLTEDNTWGVSWSNGDKVTGVAFCSITDNGVYYSGVTGDPGTTGGYAAGGQHCWCKATHYAANGAGKCALSSTVWVYHGDDNSAATCANGCAYRCSNSVQTDPYFRAPIFTGLVAQ